MKIAIAGGTGFVGTAITNILAADHHDIFILTRNPSKYKASGSVKYVQWLSDGAAPEKDLAGLDVFINLSGESLNSGRWTNDRKRRIVESRVETAKEMNRILKALGTKIDTVINASAVGIYGTSEEETFTEESQGTEDDFLSRTVQIWEKEALKSRAFSKRTVLTRFGVILGKEEGALPPMVLPYKLFGGGTIGSGRQWLSWIHIEDAARALAFCLTNESICGPVNFTAPHPMRMNDFGREIGKTLHRPHWFPVPGFLIKAVLGEMSVLILKGQKVLPASLLEHGFTFTYTHAGDALSNLLANHSDE